MIKYNIWLWFSISDSKMYGHKIIIYEEVTK